MLMKTETNQSNFKYLILILLIISIIPSLLNDTTSIFNYFTINWINEYYMLTDIQSLGLLIFLGYPLILIILGLLLWVVLIGILNINK